MVSVDDLPPPPEALPPLPIFAAEPDTVWWRIHGARRGPVFFGPAAGQPPTYRFDAPRSEYRVLYLGQTLEAAFIETLLRNPRIPFVERAEIESRCVSVLHNRHPLRLVDLRGHGLSQIGADNRLTTAPYPTAGRWALALWRHGDRPDGLLYRSRHNPDHGCAAIFDRPHCQFNVSSTKALMDIPHQWTAILADHGKGIA